MNPRDINTEKKMHKKSQLIKEAFEEITNIKSQIAKINSKLDALQLQIDSNMQNQSREIFGALKEMESRILNSVESYIGNELQKVEENFNALLTLTAQNLSTPNISPRLENGGFENSENAEIGDNSNREFENSENSKNSKNAEFEILESLENREPEDIGNEFAIAIAEYLDGLQKKGQNIYEQFGMDLPTAEEQQITTENMEEILNKIGEKKESQTSILDLINSW